MSGIESILGPGFSGMSERQQLERTAQELEAVVLTQLLGAMRKTVPEEGLFGKSMANDVFRSMLDQEIARSTAEKSPFGLADAILERLENRIKEPHESSETAGNGPKPPARAGTFRRIG